MLDRLITHATLPDGRTDMSVAVQDGRIVEVAAGLLAPAHDTVDAAGQWLSPPFCDPHFHLDATLRYCDWAVAKGLLAIRSHVDTSDASLLPVRALLEVKRRVAPYLTCNWWPFRKTACCAPRVAWTT